jgi:hypothetical protein
MAMPKQAVERARAHVSSTLWRTARWMGRTATGSAGDDELKSGGAARDGASTGLESRDQRWRTFRS